MTVIECESLAKQKDPGPMHKYAINHEYIKPRTVFFARYPTKDEKLEEKFKKDEKKFNKKEGGGPAQYNVIEAERSTSNFRKTIDVNFSGLTKNDAKSNSTN